MTRPTFDKASKSFTANFIQVDVTKGAVKYAELDATGQPVPNPMAEGCVIGVLYQRKTALQALGITPDQALKCRVTVEFLD